MISGINGVALLWALAAVPPAASGGQAPGLASTPDVPTSHRDRVYAAEQFSNTVSVTDPADNKLLGVIRLGDPSPANLSPLYHGQLLVHGMGFSPDQRTLVVVSIGSNSVTFIDTATNAVRHTSYVGRAPHEAFFTPDGSEVWVSVRGENYIAVLDPHSYVERLRITTPNGPGMTIFSPDGKYGYVCSSFTPETVVIGVKSHEILARVPQESPFCPNIAATPDGRQVWFTLKDTGRTTVFDAHPPFGLIRTLNTGPITNHVNFAWTPRGNFAYVTVGGLNVVKVFRTEDFSLVATIPVGSMPHGVWPSGDGSRMYVGLENGDALQVIDTARQAVIGEVAIGQGPQAIAYVANAVPDGSVPQPLAPLGLAGRATHLTLVDLKDSGLPDNASVRTSVTLFDQGLVQVLEAAVTGLEPGQPYILALAAGADGTGELQILARFSANPAGAAIVNAIGPIREVVQSARDTDRRYLVIAPQAGSGPGRPVQLQAPSER